VQGDTDEADTRRYYEARVHEYNAKAGVCALLNPTTLVACARASLWLPSAGLPSVKRWTASNSTAGLPATPRLGLG
jgi:hypothetical protein